MNVFNRNNKLTGVHWLKTSIQNIEINVKLKPREGIMSLPTFEDYASISKGKVIKSLKKIEKQSFKWQQKVFSLWEIVRYSDVHNCTTDVQIDYHNMLNETEFQPSKLFSYIHNDCHRPLPLTEKYSLNNIINLEKCFSALNFNENPTADLSTDASSNAYLFKSQDSINNLEEQWTSMHIVLDDSEYNVDKQLVFKQEATLISLYYNAATNCLLVSPDANDLDMNPYSVESNTGVPLGFEYAVEIIFDAAAENTEELVELLKNLQLKWEMKHKSLTNFVMPPIGKKTYLVTLEILTATNFEMNNVYIEINFRLPEDLQCSDPLRRRTHISSALRAEGVQEWHFGHQCELAIETTSILDTPSIQVFLEVISTDWWGRHRTEGYGYTPISLDPGFHNKTLSCSRPEERNEIDAESRRFFVGGCHLLKDLDVLAKPQLQDANFKYRSTGTVRVRWHVVSQLICLTFQHHPLLAMQQAVHNTNLLGLSHYMNFLMFVDPSR
ncbi:hypothetical protein ACJJTC_010850 [Scirpophaga incertulas]